MAKKEVRKLISDEVGKVLEEALAQAKHSKAGAPGALSDRDFWEAALHLDRVVAPWRDLPAELGYWHAVYMRFRRWEARGVGRRLCQFEARYESLDADNVVESAALDKGSDANRIRERLALDGIERVIPPISSRCKILPYDKALYRQRNRIERFFNKIKNFRRIATRSDKLRSPFFAALRLVSTFLLIKNS